MILIWCRNRAFIRFRKRGMIDSCMTSRVVYSFGYPSIREGPFDDGYDRQLNIPGTPFSDIIGFTLILCHGRRKKGPRDYFRFVGTRILPDTFFEEKLIGVRDMSPAQLEDFAMKWAQSFVRECDNRASASNNQNKAKPAGQVNAQAPVKSSANTPKGVPPVKPSPPQTMSQAQKNPKSTPGICIRPLEDSSASKKLIQNQNAVSDRAAGPSIG